MQAAFAPKIWGHWLPVRSTFELRSFAKILLYELEPWRLARVGNSWGLDQHCRSMWRGASPTQLTEDSGDTQRAEACALLGCTLPMKVRLNPWRLAMAEARDAFGTGANSFNWSLHPILTTPLFAVLTDINGKLLESVASAQKDWAEFVHRRVKEDIAVSQQLASCKSLGDMQQICSQYVRTAFEHYREQSERAVQRGKSTSDGLAQTLELGARDSAGGVRH
jgi:Phasin protein